MHILKGKISLITGGTGGLGIAVSSKFLEEGSNVVCTYFYEDELSRCSHLLSKYKSNFTIIKADVTKDKQVSRSVNKVIKRFKKIDVLVNLVGGFTYNRIVETEESTWDNMMNLNLKSAFLCSKSVIPHMINRNYGRIINIGSRPALRGVAGMSAYGASKAGILNLTQSMADELGEHNINVNAIIPGTIDTPANKRDMPDADFSKWVKPEEIAEVLAFLVSDNAKSINGAVIPVYGES